MTDPSVDAVYRLGTMSQKHPQLVAAERQARKVLATTILAWDEAEADPEVVAGRRHTTREQIAIDVALNEYGNALANLLRGETQ